jgi:hypothetical protein
MLVLIIETLKRPDKVFRRLRIFNLVMGFLHLIQAVVMFFIASDASLPITTNYLSPNPGAQDFAVTSLEKVYDIQLAPLIIGFLLLSSVAHFLLTLPGIYEWYVANLKKERNYARWYEYALSSSLMIVVIALLCGMYDLGSLILIFFLNASMNLFGLLMEQYNSLQKETKPWKKPNWTAYIFGCIAGIVPWIVLGLYFFTAISEVADVVPDFVYAIFYSLFIFFNIFALNMFLQYKQVGPWKNYLFGEKVYIVLSLVAKSLLAWQVFGGTLR